VTALERPEASLASHTPSAVIPELLAVTRQCAWCWLVMDATGQYRIRPGHKIKSATHGICPSCKDVVRAEIDGPVRAQPLLLAA
jgi:hypothetical protein